MGSKEGTHRWYGQRRTGTAQPGWPHTWRERWRSQTWSAGKKQEHWCYWMLAFNRSFARATKRTQMQTWMIWDWAVGVVLNVPGSSSPCWPWGSGGLRWAGWGAPRVPRAARCRMCGARSGSNARYPMSVLQCYTTLRHNSRMIVSRQEATVNTHTPSPCRPS